MPRVWSAVTALVLIFSAHGALAMGPVQSDTQFHAQVERRSPVWTTVRLCNGIQKRPAPSVAEPVRRLGAENGRTAVTSAMPWVRDRRAATNSCLSWATRCFTFA